ncbi:hypothetical protein AAW12_19165 [Sphingobacterium sp. Ag1]|nr:hypothetical protein AAW12_19165 [Sphingobacterium sp. Ag1]
MDKRKNADYELRTKKLFIFCGWAVFSLYADAGQTQKANPLGLAFQYFNLIYPVLEISFVS